MLGRYVPGVISIEESDVIIEVHLVDMADHLLMEHGIRSDISILRVALAPMEEIRIEQPRKPNERRAGTSHRSDHFRQFVVIRIHPKRTRDPAFDLCLQDDVRRILLIRHTPLRAGIRRIFHYK